MILLYEEEQKNGNGVNVVEILSETIDLRGNNNGETNFAKSNVKGTNVEIAKPVDVNNRYVSEFPITAGFDDSVYTWDSNMEEQTLQFKESYKHKKNFSH